jgi:4'-phosphopantetheinyl transferase
MADQLPRETIHIWRIKFRPTSEPDASDVACHGRAAARRWIPVRLPPRAASEPLEAALSRDERARAARFRFERDRRRFVVCRSRLRAILARYVGVSPGEIGFVYGEHGKPALAPPWDQTQIEFNLSHTQELAVVAVSREKPLGIDVERVRPVRGTQKIVARYFSPREQGLLDRLGSADLLTGFHTVWTRKEACLKAAGMGLSFPPAQIDVGLTSTDPVRFLPPADVDSMLWCVQTFRPAAHYLAALASPAGLPEPGQWQWFDLQND